MKKKDVVSLMNIKKYISLFCEAHGYTCYEDYSGRNMYGRQCIGIVCQSPLQAQSELQSYLESSNGVLDDNMMLALRDGKEDDMGKQKILYFPLINVK